MWCEAEVGHRSVAVHIIDKPRHPAAANVEHVRPKGRHLLELDAAPLAAPSATVKTSTRSSTSARQSSATAPNPSRVLNRLLNASLIAATPVQLPGSGPSACTNSISGWAQSAEPKSPRSQSS